MGIKATIFFIIFLFLFGLSGGDVIRRSAQLAGCLKAVSTVPTLWLCPIVLYSVLIQCLQSWNNTDNVININITLCRFLRKWSALIGDFFLLSFSASSPFSSSHSCKCLYRKGDTLSHFLRSTADFWNLRVIVKISLVSNMFYNITEACSLNDAGNDGLSFHPQLQLLLSTGQSQQLLHHLQSQETMCMSFL